MWRLGPRGRTAVCIPSRVRWRANNGRHPLSQSLRLREKHQAVSSRLEGHSLQPDCAPTRLTATKRGFGTPLPPPYRKMLSIEMMGCFFRPTRGRSIFDIKDHVLWRAQAPHAGMSIDFPFYASGQRNPFARSVFSCMAIRGLLPSRCLILKFCALRSQALESSGLRVFFLSRLSFCSASVIVCRV